MEQNIHSENYHTTLLHDDGVNGGWLIRSYVDTHGETMVWKDDKECPLLPLDTSSASHPVYIGKRHNINVEGRAGKLNQRYQSMMPVLRKGKWCKSYLP